MSIQYLHFLYATKLPRHAVVFVNARIQLTIDMALKLQNILALSENTTENVVL